jgi:hypothetical protein
VSIPPEELQLMRGPRRLIVTIAAGALAVTGTYIAASGA